MLNRLKRAIREINQKQNGQVLILVLVVLALGGIVLAPTLNYTATSLKHQQIMETDSLLFYSADSGIEEGLHWLVFSRESDGVWTGDDESGWLRYPPNIINDCSVSISINKLPVLGDNYFTVTSTATSADGDVTALSTIWAIHIIYGEWEPKKDTYYGDVYVDGNVDTDNFAIIIGNVIVSGDMDLDPHSSVSGNVSVEGNLILDNNTNIWGDIVCVGGNITIGNDSLVESDIYITGDNTITLNGGVNKESRVNGDIYAVGNITIIANQSATIQGNIYVTGNLTIELNQASPK